MLRVLYFASLREQLGLGQEQIPSEGIGTVGELIEHLAETHGEGWREALTTPQMRVAVNQELIEHDIALAEGDEVAFLPPVTGG